MVAPKHINKIFAKERIGAMIWPENCFRRWTAPRNFSVRFCSKTNDSPKSLVERLVDHKINALPARGFVASLEASDEASFKEEYRAPQRLAARPYNAMPTPMQVAGSDVGLHAQNPHHQPYNSIQSCARSGTFVDGLPTFKQDAIASLSLSMHFLLYGKSHRCIAPWRTTRWRPMMMCVGWTVSAA